MVQIGGFDSTLVDFEIPRKYGLNFTIADTTGPGAICARLRTFPMLTGLCRDMAEVCPNALLLNYSNPMSMNMQTIVRGRAACAPSGSATASRGRSTSSWATSARTPATSTFLCAGINHMAFYLRIEKNGVDLYPRSVRGDEPPRRSYAQQQSAFRADAAAGVFRHRKLASTTPNTARILSRTAPTRRPSSACPIDEYLRRCDAIVDEFERIKVAVAGDEPSKSTEASEYGSTIIHSMATGTPSVVYGNMPNHGAIANLPATAIAEAPTLVDRTGLHFQTVGELPPQLIGYMQPHVAQHELFIRAALEGRRDHIYQAAMFDPLTAATLTLDKIVEMCDELIAAHGDLLPRWGIARWSAAAENHFPPSIPNRFATVGISVRPIANRGELTLSRPDWPAFRRSASAATFADRRTCNVPSSISFSSIFWLINLWSISSRTALAGSWSTCAYMSCSASPPHRWWPGGWSGCRCRRVLRHICPADRSASSCRCWRK